MEAELVAGAFETEEAIVAAAGAARKSSLLIYDAFTPFPVHGLDKAMGLAPSALPTICFRCAAVGLSLALGFEYWASSFDWPMNVGGKSFSASPALLPIAFELTVLFAALGSVGAFLYMRGLNPNKAPAFTALGGLDAAFVLALRGQKDSSQTAALTRFLQEHGAIRVGTEKDQ